jgi:hypothetical protein
MNINEIMKLLPVFLLQGLHQKLDNEQFFLEENSGNTHILGPVLVRGGFTFSSSFFILLTMKKVNVGNKVQLRKLYGGPVYSTLFPMLPYGC